MRIRYQSNEKTSPLKSINSFWILTDQSGFFFLSSSLFAVNRRSVSCFVSWYFALLHTMYQYFLHFKKIIRNYTWICHNAPLSFVIETVYIGINQYWYLKGNELEKEKGEGRGKGREERKGKGGWDGRRKREGERNRGREKREDERAVKGRKSDRPIGKEKRKKI